MSLYLVVLNQPDSHFSSTLLFLKINKNYQALSVPTFTHQSGFLFFSYCFIFICLISLNFKLCRSLFGMLICSVGRPFATLGAPIARYMLHLQQCFHSSWLLWPELRDKAQLIIENLLFKRKSLFCIHTNEKIYMVNTILSLYISPEKEAILKL